MEKNQIPKNVANFIQPVDAGEHTAKFLVQIIQKMGSPSCRTEDTQVGEEGGCI